MKRVLATLSLLIALLGISYVPQAAAYDAFQNCTSTNSEQCGMVKNEKKLDYTTNATGVWKLVQQALIILGGIAVIMIVVGGIKYVVSNGDSSAVTSAKNTILYSIIGLIVALSAAAIIGFVTNYFG